MKQKVTIYFSRPYSDPQTFENVTHIITDDNLIQLHFNDLSKSVIIPFYNVLYYKIEEM